MNEPKSPLAVNLKLTNKCNLNCVHCIAESGKKGNLELTYGEIVKLIDEFKDNEIFLIDFTGGEPLTHPRFFEILEYSNSKKFMTTLSTNGTLVTEDVARKLKRFNVSLVKVSLDSHNEKAHDTYRGVSGAYKRTMTGIKYLLQNNIPVTIQCTVSKYNILDLKSIVELAIKIGVQNINFFPVVPGGRANGMRDQLFSSIEFKQFLEITQEIEEEYKEIRVLSESPLHQVYRGELHQGKTKEDGNTYKCLASKVMLFIKEDGEVVPCPYFFESIGNLKEKSLIEIWRNSTLLNKLRDDTYLASECKLCDYSKECFGGCRAGAFYTNGGINFKDPYCWI